MNPLAVHLGKNLLRCRERANLSQEELAFRASLHRTEISQLERGMRLPRIDTLLKLSGGLGMAPEALLDGMAWNAGQITPGGFSVGGNA